MTELQRAIDSLQSLDPEKTDVYAIRLVLAEVERLRGILCEVRDTGEQMEGPGGPVILLPRAVWSKAAEAAGGDDGK